MNVAVVGMARQAGAHHQWSRNPVGVDYQCLECRCRLKPCRGGELANQLRSDLICEVRRIAAVNVMMLVKRAL
jgi:hypothetical protein